MFTPFRFDDGDHISIVLKKEQTGWVLSDEDHDADKKYTVDCRINGLPEPIFVYALFNNDRIRDATIALQRFNVWNIPHCPLGIFENKEDTNRKVKARFDDVCQVQFPNMRVNHNEIIDYISKRI